MSENEIERRKKTAMDAIRKLFGTPEGDDTVNLFISHHIEEIEDDYRLKHPGTADPEPARVFEMLEFKQHRGDDYSDSMDTFDFTLPDDITDYAVCVFFDSGGQVKSVPMES